jgi:hypothetical protein
MTSPFNDHKEIHAAEFIDGSAPGLGKNSF